MELKFISTKNDTDVIIFFSLFIKSNVLVLTSHTFHRSFTHETGDFIHFKLEDLTFLLFRSIKPKSQLLHADSSLNE